jgi:NAD(P)-dependent dehydrogenase (short-subunit alcohol dehydrogenase family)
MPKSSALLSAQPRPKFSRCTGRFPHIPFIRSTRKDTPHRLNVLDPSNPRVLFVASYSCSSAAPRGLGKIHLPPFTMSKRRVALITASSAGLGASTAKLFASSGFNVVINYRSSQGKAEKIIQDILQDHASARKNGITNGDVHVMSSLHPERQPHCIAVQADMSRREDIAQLVTSTVEVMSRLDVVVSNHGWTRIRNFSDLDDNVDEDDWDTCYNMNVKSHLYLFHAARPYLEATNGTFISVASLAGVVPSGSSIVCLCPFSRYSVGIPP